MSRIMMRVFEAAESGIFELGSIRKSHYFPSQLQTYTPERISNIFWQVQCENSQIRPEAQMFLLMKVHSDMLMVKKKQKLLLPC